MVYRDMVAARDITYSDRLRKLIRKADEKAGDWCERSELTGMYESNNPEKERREYQLYKGFARKSRKLKRELFFEAILERLHL